MSDSDLTPGERLRKARVAAGYKTAAEFAAKHGIPQPTYQQHETAKRGLKVPVAKGYERMLGNVDAAWILTGHGKAPPASDVIQLRPALEARERPASYEPMPRSPTRVRAVTVVARVQAGHWRETPELPGDERYDIFVPIPEVYAEHQVLSAEVVGNSMDLVYPEGSILVCVSTIGLGEDWTPIRGDRVVARRMSREGFFETTVKEYVVDDQGKGWLVPRSTDPSLTAVPAERAEADDDEPIRIIGLVVGSYRPERRRGDGA